MLGGDPRGFYRLDPEGQLDVLAYHTIVTDPHFAGRFGLLGAMTLGQRAHLEVMLRGGGKQSNANGGQAAASMRRKLVKDGAPQSGADFWFTSDAQQGVARG